MKIKTSITLSSALLAEMDEIIHDSGNRSRFIEEAVTAHIEKRKKALRNDRDLELINAHERALNREATDVLSFQVKV